MKYSNEEIFGWGRTKPVKVKVVTPKNLEEIKCILDKSDEESILARGLGRSYGDSAQLKNGTILKLSEFKNVSLNKKRQRTIY